MVAAYSIVSTTSSTDGSGGKMNSFWAVYSLRMSFCSVPVSSDESTPRSSATTRYIASIAAAEPVIVSDVDTSSSGMPSNSACVSSTVSTATPVLPTSRTNTGWSESWPSRVGRSKSVESPVSPWASRYL